MLWNVVTRRVRSDALKAAVAMATEANMEETAEVKQAKTILHRLEKVRPRGLPAGPSTSGLVGRIQLFI